MNIKKLLLWIASLITYLPYTKKRSSLVDKLIILSEKEVKCIK